MATTLAADVWAETLASTATATAAAAAAIAEGTLSRIYFTQVLSELYRSLRAGARPPVYAMLVRTYTVCFGLGGGREGVVGD